MGSAHRKARFLGMSHGTAANRLRKQLLFKYIKQAGDHICFKCGQEIQSVDDLSIEHKEPWEGRSVEAFWDLDNVAFSHLRCNVPNQLAVHMLVRRHAPEGTSWCCTCKSYISLEGFHKSAREINGVQRVCKSCRSVERKNLRADTMRA